MNGEADRDSVVDDEEKLFDDCNDDEKEGLDAGFVDNDEEIDGDNDDDDLVAEDAGFNEEDDDAESVARFDDETEVFEYGKDEVNSFDEEYEGLDNEDDGLDDKPDEKVDGLFKQDDDDEGFVAEK